MIEVSMVPSEYIDTCWDKVEGFMERAAKYTYGRYATKDIYSLIVNDGYQLWVAYDEGTFKAAVVTSIMDYPQKRMLCMQFCGGDDMKDWLDPVLNILKRFAKDNKCEGLESTARPGWAKIFKNDGYTASWVAFELPLDTE